MARAPHARLFVAVDPPPAVQEELAAWARGAGGALTRDRAAGNAPPLRLLDSDALHVTLCFLGSRPVGEIDAIAAVSDFLSIGTNDLVQATLGLDRLTPAATVRAPAEEKSRERVLKDDELAALWRVAELEGHRPRHRKRRAPE